MKATWNDTVIAEANDDELIKIEGNRYFLPDAKKRKNSANYVAFRRGVEVTAE